MADPFSPNRFIHEVDSSQTSGPARPATNRFPLQRQLRMKNGIDGDARLVGGLEAESAAGHLSSRSVAQSPRALKGPTTAANRSNSVRALSPRALAFLCGIFLSLLFFCAAYAPSVLSSSSPRELDPLVKAYIDRVVNKALRDPVGRRDFALLADGAIVLSELTKIVSPKGVKEPPLDSHPEAALSDDTRIGSCWLVPSSAAQLGLRLSAMIHPTHVSIDHIPFEIAADIGRAPRLMHLWGGVDGDTNEARLDGLTHTSRIAIPHTRVRLGPQAAHGYKFIRLGSFEYDIRASSHVQTFALDPSFADSGMYFGVVVLEIASNWGANATCLYRLRVHGDRYDSGQ